MSHRGGLGAKARSQRGVVIVMFALALLAMLGMAGLAIDFGHATLNKTRLQNSLDAAALAAAKVLDQTRDQAQAREAAYAAFAANLEAAGNAELGAVGASATPDALNIEFSHKLQPFSPDGAATRFVRVTMNDTLAVPTSFLSLFDQPQIAVDASAVAGPSTPIVQSCNVIPMALCGDPAGPDLWGHRPGDDVVIKEGAQSHGSIGPGNFQLLALFGKGGSDIRKALDSGGCATVGATVGTAPGNKVGPVFQGLNTRFGQYEGPMKKGNSGPPDLVTDEGISYEDYLHRYTEEDFDEPNGSPGRRIVVVPVIRCDGTAKGSSSVRVEGLACLFLKEKAIKGGKQEVHAEAIGTCDPAGIPGSNNGTGGYIIQLYGDTDRWDS